MNSRGFDRSKPYNGETAAVRTGIAEDPGFGAVTPPVYLTSTFAFSQFGDKPDFDYSRCANPTRAQLATTLARLESGCHATITSSGMSALATLFHYVGSSGSIIAPHDCYAGTRRLLDALADRGGSPVAYVDQTRPDELRNAIDSNTALVLVETPSNPLLRISDIAAIVAIARENSQALVAVDNTFLSPAFQRPLTLGADIVVHSTTKFLNGHSDVVGGVLVTRDPAVGNAFDWWANCIGVTGGALDSFLTLRGVRTLFVRARQAQDNARSIVELLAQHRAVAALYYPGLPSHPDHAVACDQQTGFGAMISFELAGGRAAVEAFLDGLDVMTLAESLGGTESLVAHPASMTHAAMTPEQQRDAGIGDGLLRLSVGIEAVDDLIADISAALDRAV